MHVHVYMNQYIVRYQDYIAIALKLNNRCMYCTILLRFWLCTFQKQQFILLQNIKKTIFSIQINGETVQNVQVILQIV